jgi:hypothetical protein
VTFTRHYRIFVTLSGRFGHEANLTQVNEAGQGVAIWAAVRELPANVAPIAAPFGNEPESFI